MLHTIANAAAPRGLRHVMAGIEPRRAEIFRTKNGARITFSDRQTVTLDKEPATTESAFMVAILQWTKRHGAHSITVEYQ